MKKIAALFEIVFLLTLIFSCKEKIPNGPKRGKVMDAQISTKNERTNYVQWNHYDDRYELRNINETAFEQMMAWKVPFTVKLTNVFDEIIDGTKEIRIRVKIWEPGRNWIRHFSYTEINLADSVLLHPGETHSFYTADSLIWDQRDDTGKCIFPVGHYKWYLVQEVLHDTLVPDTVNNKPGYKTRLWGDCDTLAVFDKDSVIAFKGTVAVLATASVQLFHEYLPVQSDTLKLHIRYYFPSSYLKRKIGCYSGFRGNGG